MQFLLSKTGQVVRMKENLEFFVNHVRNIAQSVLPVTTIIHTKLTCFLETECSKQLGYIVLVKGISQVKYG